jgi:hypothetical protein
MLVDLGAGHIHMRKNLKIMYEWCIILVGVIGEHARRGHNSIDIFQDTRFLIKR